MTFSASRAFFLVAMSTAVSAQFSLGGLGLSEPCQSALEGLLENQGLNNCLNIPGLFAIGTTAPNSSYVPAINNWLAATCARDPCPSDAIAAAATAVTGACEADLQANGATGVTTEQIVESFQQYYPVLREVLCLKNTQPQEHLCVTETLQNLESAAGRPLSSDNILGSLASGGISFSGGTDGTSVNTTLACTPCSQAAYARIKEAIPENASSAGAQQVIDTCGPAFESNSNPPANIVDGTGANAVQLEDNNVNGAGRTFTPFLTVAGALVAGTLLLA